MTRPQHGEGDSSDATDPTLVELCEVYTHGPAALARLTPEGSFLGWRARSREFSNLHEDALEQHLEKGSSSDTVDINGVHWSITFLRQRRYAFLTARKIAAMEPKATKYRNIESNATSTQRPPQKLKISELPYSRMASILPIGLSVAGPESVPSMTGLSRFKLICLFSGMITEVNDAWWAVTGHNRNWHPSRFAESICDEDRDVTVEKWTRLIAGEPVPQPIEFRWKTGTAKSIYRWCWGYCAVEHDQDGQVALIISAILDVTAQKDLQSLQEQRAEEAESMRQTQERFIDM